MATPLHKIAFLSIPLFPSAVGRVRATLRDVAALGAKGLRYLVIQAGLSAGVSLAAFISGFVPPLAIAALSTWIFGSGFMVVGFLAQVAIVALGCGRPRQLAGRARDRRARPHPGDGPSLHDRGHSSCGQQRLSILTCR